MRYSVAPELFAAWPGYVRGVMVFDDLDNTAAAPELTALLRDAEASVRRTVTGNVAELPQVAAWRAAYRDFGARPSDHRSAIEALLRRVVKPDDLPAINPLVDIGNLVSLRHLLPAGVHPVPSLDVRIALRRAVADDRFAATPDDPPETVAPGEIVLADGPEVLTRRWTWRQSFTTRTLPATTRVFVDLDGLPPTRAADIAQAMRDTADLVRRFCGGRCLGEAVLDAARPSFSVAEESP